MIKLDHPGIGPMKDLFLWNQPHAFVGFYCLLLAVWDEDPLWMRMFLPAPILWEHYQVVERGYKGTKQLYVEQI